MRVRIIRETRHGNPGESRVLPVGVIALIIPADNLPASSPIDYWAHCPSPIDSSGWPVETREWACMVGLGLQREDFEPVNPRKPVPPRRS